MLKSNDATRDCFDKVGGDASSAIEFADVTYPMLEKLVSDMDRRGFGVISNFLSEPYLQQMRGFVASAIAATSNEYMGFIGKDAVAGSVFADLSDTSAFRSLMRRVYEHGTGTPAPDADMHQVLRCLAGETGKAHSLIFHYDSYVVTALIPVEIPLNGQSGDLVMLPNRRRIRRSYVANLIDKVLLDNKLTQVMLRVLLSARLLPIIRVKMVPGNIYFFWGYRSIHANEACDPNRVRATAIYHFCNPHVGNKLRTTVRTLLPRS